MCLNNLFYVSFENSVVHQNSFLTLDNFLYSCHLLALKCDEHCLWEFRFGSSFVIIGDKAAFLWVNYIGIHKSLLKRSTFTVEGKAFIVSCNKWFSCETQSYVDFTVLMTRNQLFWQIPICGQRSVRRYRGYKQKITFNHRCWVENRPV